MENLEITKEIQNDEIKNLIYTIRGKQDLKNKMIKQATKNSCKTQEKGV